MSLPRLFVLLGCALLALAANTHADPTPPSRLPHAGNPLLPGYYADPSIIEHEGRTFLYATLDPWGGDTLGCWESTNLVDWTYRELTWPTKAACTSPTSNSSKVWAPSVVRGPDGRFYLYVSVGSEVWVGVAPHPLGPWTNALGDRPLIPHDYKPGFHMIDAEAFIDDDGTPYLYWGSGLRWVNGRCWAVKLKPDMVTFDGEVHDVTPANYFEGPFMVKHGGRYYLTYSQGKTTTDTYQVHYAVGATPFGPFTEASNSPILVTDRANDVISPGHHAVFTRAGQAYILYHRHSLPFDPKFIGRQTCVDPLVFTADGLIARVAPTHTGPAGLPPRAGARTALAATATASSARDAATLAPTATDDNYATLWKPAADARGAWLQLDFGTSRRFADQSLRFEYAWKPYAFAIASSSDGVTWTTVVDHRTTPVKGSPFTVTTPGEGRYLRLVFPDSVPGAEIGVFEWSVQPLP